MDDANAAHEAFIMLLLLHEAGIRAFIRTVVHRAEDVDEVMQAVGLVAWRKFDSLTDREGFGRWACVIARYETLRFLRTRARDRFVLDTDLAAGRARAIVPPTARGFTVVTRGVAYEDVGTEFGLSVDGATGASQMHVFDGQVNLRRGDVEGPLLRRAFAGDSVGFRDGQVVEVPEMEMDPGAFPSPGTIGHQRWASRRTERLADPGLLAWFPFERGDNPSLLVNAVREHGLLDGRIVGAHWATGRWPGKQALWFDRDSDFVEIEIPGEHAELTVAVWLKVDRFEREFSAILNSNGAEEGGYHLQMNRHGLPRGGLLGVERPNQRWVGHPVPTGK
ncbi:MAG: hypothetical protein KJ072_05860 [Verrucomicrobia bacterium]|nr:hypothetical protein [Verrucomicrobiota bacterium]